MIRHLVRGEFAGCKLSDSRPLGRFTRQRVAAPGVGWSLGPTCYAIVSPLVLASLLFGTQSFAQTASRAGATELKDWRSIQSAAQSEGKVVLYSQSQPPLLARLKADFEAAHPGLVLEYSRMSGSPMVARIEQERISKAEGADVVEHTELAWFLKGTKAGWFKPPSGPASREWPAAAMFGGGVPILGYEPFGLMVYNASIVNSPITAYPDLLRPDLKGKIAIAQPGSSPAAVAWYDWLERMNGPEFLTGLAGQKPRMVASSLPGVQSVAAGEFAVTAFSNLAAAQSVASQGAPIKVVIPKRMLAVAYGGAALAWSKRPNAALVFMDYMMSTRGQTVRNAGGEYGSPIAGIPRALDSQAMEVFDQTPYTADVLKARIEKLNRIFGTR